MKNNRKFTKPSPAQLPVDFKEQLASLGLTEQDLEMTDEERDEAALKKWNNLVKEVMESSG